MYHYFLGTRLLASAPMTRDMAHSQAYFCPTCGEVWFRILADESPNHFDLRTVYCQRHEPAGVPGWEAVPGTICQGTLTSISTMRHAAALETLPLFVLEREFTIEYQHDQRNQNGTYARL